MSSAGDLSNATSLSEPPPDSVPTSTTPTPTPTPISKTPTPTPTPTLPPPDTSTTPTPTKPTTSSVVTIKSTAPAQTSTQLFTSFVTQTPTGSDPGSTTVVITSSNGNQQTTGPSTSSSTNNAVNPTSQASKSGGGLSPTGKTAIAVVIPIVVVACLIIAGIFYWRRRNQNRDLAEERRKEMEAYQYNPNNDPTLPAVALSDPERSSGYRGWGGSSGLGRKSSTNASSGVPASSPTSANYFQDPYNRNGTMGSDAMDNLAPVAAPAIGIATTTGPGGNNLQRRDSNASSRYSQGALSNVSHTDQPVAYTGNQQDYYSDNTYYPANQTSPYEAYNNGAQPIMRESPARRLTSSTQDQNRIPQQGGIARNF
jgi:hypothetical protein